MRALDFVRAFDELGFAVDLLVADQGPAGEAQSLSRVEFFAPTPADRLRGLASAARGAPLQTVPFRSMALEQAVLSAIASLSRDDVALVQLARQGPLLERIGGFRRKMGPTLLVDLIDLLSLNFQRRGQIAGGLRGLFWRAEAQRLRRMERDVVARCDAVTVVCERDRLELIRFEDSARLKAITTPLPVDAVQEAAGPSGTRSGRRSLVFTGNLGYFVNDHAIQSFLASVWPRLVAQREDLDLVVAGARPSRALRRACARAGATLRPNPSDLREILRGADLALAPLVGGAGVPVKVLEAWSEDVPVLASDWCARGLLTEGEGIESIDEALFRIPDPTDADGFMASIHDALDHPEEARARARAGRLRLERLHSFSVFREAVEELVRIGRNRSGS